MGACPNVGLMAQKASEPKNFNATKRCVRTPSQVDTDFQLKYVCLGQHWNFLTLFVFGLSEVLSPSRNFRWDETRIVGGGVRFPSNHLWDEGARYQKFLHPNSRFFLAEIALINMLFWWFWLLSCGHHNVGTALRKVYMGQSPGHLPPPPVSPPPPRSRHPSGPFHTGKRGTSLTHFIYTLYTTYTQSLRALHTFYIQSILILCTFYLHPIHILYTLYIRCIYTIHSVRAFFALFTCPLTSYTCTTWCRYRYAYTFTCTNASTLITNTYTTYWYTNAIVSPLHTTYPHHRGGGRTYLSARLLYFVIAYYILFPLPHNIPPPQGGRGNLSLSTLTKFCHHLLHLVPPSTQHTPTTGERGRTYLSHSAYTLYTRSIYTVYTFYIHSIFTVYTQYIVYVLSMHFSHAFSKFYSYHIHIQLNVATEIHTHLHVQMHPHL